MFSYVGPESTDQMASDSVFGIISGVSQGDRILYCLHLVTSQPWLAETFAPKNVFQFGLETAHQWILHKVTSAHPFPILHPAFGAILHSALSLYCLKLSMISLTETVIGRKVNLLLCVTRKTGKKCRIGCGSTT